MDEDIIKTIVKFTNQYIFNIFRNYSDQSSVYITNEIEVNRFIGMLILAGVLHAGRLNVEEVWDRDGTEV